MFSVVRNKLYDSLGACCDARSARTAFIIVHGCNSVYYLNCVKLTCRLAGTETDTAVRTQLVAAGKLVCRRAVGYSLINVLLFCKIMRTRTHNLSTVSLAVLCFNTHNLAYFGKCFVGCGIARVYRSLALDNCLGKRLAAGISASAAVCAGQTLGNFFYSLVSVYRKNLACNRKNYSEYAAYYGKTR